MIEWSSKNFNLSVDQEEVYQGYRSVIACMTEDKGIDHCQIYDNAINTPKPQNPNTPREMLCVK